MIFKQYYLGCLAQASYLIGDESSQTAVIVDPRRDAEIYLEEASHNGLKIRHVFLSHFHADFAAGHLELRNRVGAEVCLGAKAKAQYPFRPMKDGEVLEFGKVRLKILETPGHTPESISILVFDLEKDSQNPSAVLTGDCLFIGDVGRPDLMASIGISAKELAGMLYDSLRNKLMTLPDPTLVYPAHGAGSLCGKKLGTETVSTIGEQRRYNYALQPMTKEEFIRLVTADQPEAPQYFSYDAQFNRSEHSSLDEALRHERKPLSPIEVLDLKKQGAQILDVRDPTDFARGHLIGSLNIGLGGKFASWAGTLLDRHKPVILIAESGMESEAALRLGRIGFDIVAGYLDGGMQALEMFPKLVQKTERITAPALAEQLESDSPPVILDVRTPTEWQEKHIGGSLNIPLNHLKEKIPQIPKGKNLVVHCASGYRSSIAASLLEQDGLSNPMDLVGGFAAWEASQLKSEKTKPE